MKFDYLQYRYPSRRSVIFGQRGMVCTSQPLAAQAGLDILKQGGNAADAIIATAACMTVLEPTSNGMGSDAFALYWNEKEKKLYGLNGSGYAPSGLTLEGMQQKGYAKMPERGWESVDVPGAPLSLVRTAQKVWQTPLYGPVAACYFLCRKGFSGAPHCGSFMETGRECFCPV